MQCNMHTKSLLCISIEVCNLPYYDGLEYVKLFMDKFERDVSEEHCFQALYIALRATPTRWWGTHKNNFTNWKEYQRMMKLRLGYANTHITEKYIGKDDSCENLARWTKAWGEEPQLEWVHIFFHTFDTIPMNWYLETELQHGITKWDVLKEIFLLIFSF